MNLTVKGYWIFLFKLEEFLADFHVTLEIKETGLTLESVYPAHALYHLGLEGKRNQAWNSGAVTAGYC